MIRKKKEDGAGKIRVRMLAVLGFFVFFFIVIFARAFQLQVLESKDLQRMAANQHRKTINVQSKRGDIYDRNEKELAVSIEVDSVFAQPQKIGSPKDTARKLSRILSMDRSEIEKRLRAPKNFVWLKRQVDLKDEERKLVSAIDGVGIMKESRRYYPNRQLASNIIGFTGMDSSGLEGIELYYDTLLRGVSYKFTGDKDARGRLLLYEDVDKKTPLQGREVELTIDKTIQYVTEKELKKAVDDTGAKGGVSIVMDPHTGEILAMASVPSFDPNNFGTFVEKSFKNRAVTDAVEPGSVFKLFLISAALEESLIKPDDTIYCENGSYRVADRTFHDVKSYGRLSVAQIIKYSSNIGAAKIGEKLGKVRLYRYLKSYGFGGKTGIDLPGESAGSLRNYKDWSAVTLETVSFGQGVSTTPIQLITALSAVANGGFLMKPYVVKASKDSKGNIISENNPVIVRRVVSDATAKKVTEMLIGVTQPGGTATRAAMDGFDVAGKTGTAQKPDFKKGGYRDGAFTSSFFGFVPARNPRLAILVMLDEPRGEYHGGTVSAPVFKNIASQSLAYMGVFPEGGKLQENKTVSAAFKDAPEPIENAPQKADPADASAAPDFTGKTVRNVLKMAKAKSIEIEVFGSGKAIAQKPQAGRGLPANGHVSVWFQ